MLPERTVTSPTPFCKDGEPTFGPLDSSEGARHPRVKVTRQGPYSHKLCPLEMAQAFLKR